MSMMMRAGAGLAAGALATYVMDSVGSAFYARESEAAKKHETDVEPKSALTVLAERVLHGLGEAEPTTERVASIANVIHWAFGAGNGIVYALLENRVPVLCRGFGFPFAVGLYAFDEFGLPAFGLTPKPKDFPMETHLRSLSTHLVYGAVLSVAFRGLTR